MVDQVDIDKVAGNSLTDQEATKVSEEVRRYRRALPPQASRSEGADGSVVDRHPSYAVVTTSRVSGQAKLFDSHFAHQHFIRLSIHAAQVEESDHSRRIRPNGLTSMVEIYMSETQFARMITSMSQGQGAPCTLNRFMGASVEKPPEERSDAEKHTDRIEAKVREVVELDDDTIAGLEEMLEAKRRPTLSELRSLIKTLTQSRYHRVSNTAHIHEVLSETMEERVSQAKDEIDAHVSAIVGQAQLTDCGVEEIRSAILDQKPGSTIASIAIKRTN